jgi:hypothetical protein
MVVTRSKCYSRFEWLSIDYRQVSTETCQELFRLVEKDINIGAYTESTPETPRQQQIAQQIDCVITEHLYFAKK